MIVIRNTYPRWPKIRSAEAGDEVEWRAGRGQWLLTRKADGAVVFSRDCLPKHEEDTRPMVGVIASVVSKGWFLELSNASLSIPGGEPGYAPGDCSAWISVDVEPVPDGLVCDMVDAHGNRFTDVVYLDDDVWPEDALHHDPNGPSPDPIDICPITEITHWSKIVLPNAQNHQQEEVK